MNRMRMGAGTRPLIRWLFASCLLAGLGGTPAVHAVENPPTDPAGIEFFEKEIRPLLAEHCLKCHGGKNDKGEVIAKGKLILSGRDALLRGGESGPAAVAGNSRESLLIQSIRYELDSPRMPPKGKLTEKQIALLERWVQLGLPFPEAKASAGTPGSFRITEEQRGWWAFQPVKAGEPPAVKEQSWPRSEIDRFILAELEARGIKHAPPADRRTLIRRVSFDLLGLPPTPEEMEAALSDTSQEWFEKLVDRLLANPAYGQRWGRHWLDVVRYTDYHAPDPNAHPSAKKFELFEAWRYRDWVVDAINRDLPFDQFIVHQIAGDRLSSPTGDAIYPEGLIASTFLAIGTWDNGDADKHKVVSDIVDDQIDAVGKAFLGMTLACARCHDHKFDPISNDDYYGLAGIFYSTRILANVGTKGDHTVAMRVPLVPPAYLARRDKQQQELRDLTHSLIRRTGSLAGLAASSAPLGVLGWSGANGGKLFQQLADRSALERGLLPAPPLALAAQEGGTPGSLFPGIQDVPVHIRGSYTRLGPVVKRHLPHFLAGEEQPTITNGSGRLELARWIASKENPLTARVIVNRVWQHHFGEGIVGTPNNFGKLGQPPTHPQLLDWLARQFIADGWSLKHLHRRILLSATYQQSSSVERGTRNAELNSAPTSALRDPRSVDPDNRWLARMNVRRLEAEAIRDAMLVAAGRLDGRPGGPATAELSSPRRSLYIQTVRQDRSNYSTLFDAADPEQSVEKRVVSTVAPQALFLINSPFVRQQAEHMGRRFDRGDEATRIDRAYRWLFARPPRSEEVEIGIAFLRRARSRGDAAWADYFRLLLCTNEFVYID